MPYTVGITIAAYRWDWDKEEEGLGDQFVCGGLDEQDRIGGEFYTAWD